MLKHPCFDPVALHLGPLAIRWYGLMYLVAFVLFIVLARHRVRQFPERGWSAVAVDDLLFYGVLGVILGGRLGYVLFYKLDYYLQHPLEILAIWQGGMSFHGGFLGVIFAMWLYAKRRGKHWFAVTDFIAPMVPLGYAFGRIGNFINAELPGRRTDLPWGMLFPRYYDENAGECVWPGLGEASARHPSQLYQAALDGFVLFVILWVYSRKSRPLGAVSALFLIGYGLFRFLVEFTREPDDFLGLLALNLSMGQWLSLPMIVGGVVMMVWAYRQPAGKR